MSLGKSAEQVRTEARNVANAARADRKSSYPHNQIDIPGGWIRFYSLDGEIKVRLCLDLDCRKKGQDLEWARQALDVAAAGLEGAAGNG